MPRRTTYLLRWSEQRYEMTGGLPDAELPDPTSPEWLNWLSAISSFAFVCRLGGGPVETMPSLARSLPLVL